jgi:hypothetical protein
MQLFLCNNYMNKLKDFNMRIIKIAVALSFTLVLSACVSAPPIQQPIQFSESESYELYRSNVLDQTNHTLQHLNENKDILYFQTHGGGGAGVGVLFGPLGVMANIKMIESNTMKDVAVLKDKVAIDPNQLFLDAAIKYGIAISNGASNTNYRLNPYLLVQKIESDVIMIASAILVDHAGSNSKVPSRYLIQLPATYSIDELSSLDAEGIQQLEKLVENGYLTLISRIIAESNANIELDEKVTLTSEFLTPRFNIQLAGNLIDKDETYTWLRLVGGVYGVKNSDVVLKMADARKR